MPVLIDKRDLAVLHAASKDETRYMLCSVLVEKDGTLVATDGRMLLAVTREREAEGLDADAVVERPDAEALRKAVPKNGHAVLATSGGKFQADAGSTTLTGVLVDGEYVKWRNVRPTGEPETTLRVDARLLERLAKAAIEYAGGSRKEPIWLDIEVRDDRQPLVVKYERGDGAELEALVMPCRKD